ncbi:erythromycin biosynthesis sensory transduction protein eryC1 [Nocardioides sp. S5]|uniref:DegT/DnrJ/EryC1/StrS family aminotransferase n=1 Tax=Nocardioides sp. S5 TaxID=2017486 RepID=UPI001A8E6954|nr:DegT/DnrJ/EryC1/StrS family aminotransferase [Nocardioides sp. S5]QSR32558.1 erythromycin biosynthesis sensory transduction protein eryC1 [Nocardioides sp. S5]
MSTSTTPPQVPFVDLASQHAEIADEIEAGIAAVFATTAFVDGPPVAAFEQQYADFVGVDHCVGVANGTDAIELALRAAGVRPGGEVIVPANTFIATAEAASRIGAVPVPVDVDDERLLIDPTQVEAAINDRTQAVAAVHLFGQLAPMQRLAAICRDAGVALVEDAAQSQGARTGGLGAGAIGTVGATSFYPGKNLGAAGDAGAVTTNDATIAAEIRRLRSHGSSVRYVHDVVGMNSRLDTIQAVYLRAKLDRLEKWNELRVRAAARYDRLLAGVEGVRRPLLGVEGQHVWHLYVVRVAERDRVLAELGRAGIGAGIHYPYPVHLTGAYADLGMGRGTAPVAEAAAGEILSLPMHPHLTEAMQDRVVEVLASAVEGTEYNVERGQE